MKRSNLNCKSSSPSSNQSISKANNFATMLSGMSALLLAVAISLLPARTALAANTDMSAKAGKADAQHLQKAIFAGGCFWGVEDDFRHVKGVSDAISGFTGGTLKNPSYKDVCSGTTHHAEAVEVLYDPAKVSYNELLNTFWKMHDPTTMNRQGPDFGEQYRSAIFYLNDEQKKEALASRDKLAAAKTYNGPIVTQIVPATAFYKAEEYHQHYFEKNPGAAACHRR